MNVLRVGEESLCQRRVHVYVDRLSPEHGDEQPSGLQRFASLLHAKVARVLRS